ncbi:MAG TPA: hypothetical protein VHV26_17995, partial [Rhizomicrobium sp.]|nr:hypothetical protein [Rhizomicrobium sp.]
TYGHRAIAQSIRAAQRVSPDETNSPDLERAPYGFAIVSGTLARKCTGRNLTGTPFSVTFMLVMLHRTMQRTRGGRKDVCANQRA